MTDSDNKGTSSKELQIYEKRRAVSTRQLEHLARARNIKRQKQSEKEDLLRQTVSQIGNIRQDVDVLQEDVVSLDGRIREMFEKPSKKRKREIVAEEDNNVEENNEQIATKRLRTTDKQPNTPIPNNFGSYVGLLLKFGVGATLSGLTLWLHRLRQTPQHTNTFVIS